MAAGVARFAYNWALDEWGRQYEEWKLDRTLPRPSELALRRRLNSLKREKFPWMLEVTKCAPQLAIMQLGSAFKNFFLKKAAYPKYRKKGVRDRFSLSNDQFVLDGSRIRIPNLGWVRMREALRFSGKIISATISREADTWFVSISVDMPNLCQSRPPESQGAVGVDLGISALATTSDGKEFVGPRPHKRLIDRQRRLSRGVSRKKLGSKNREKAKAKLSRLCSRIANIRKDALHKLTTELVKSFDLIGIEGLNVSGMVRNRRLARSIMDMGFGEFRRQIEYKAPIFGAKVFVADSFYPSSKTCSCCGSVKKSLKLSERMFSCEDCGNCINRDLNAAINLRNLAVSSTVSACGEIGSGFGSFAEAKPYSVKQERARHENGEK